MKNDSKSQRKNKAENRKEEAESNEDGAGH